MPPTSVLVFTRDLRVTDNPALAAAARGGEVVPLFVFDPAILRGHAGNATRLAFLLDSLRDLDAGLRSLGGHLVVRHGQWAESVLAVASQAGAGQIHVAEDVSGFAVRRLARLESLSAQARRAVLRHPGVMVTGPGEVSPAYGGPYQVFTPYYRKWLAAARRDIAAVPARLAVPGHLDPGRIPGLPELGGGRPARAASESPGGERPGLARLRDWREGGLVAYGRLRDDLAAGATSRLSPYLHLGCVSPLVVESELGGVPGAGPFIRQLAWRDFFSQLLAARPEAAWRDYRGRGRRWHDDPDGLAAWKAGLTGYPVVDAAMRQLAAEGFMHNRARMIVASFLTKDLGIDWRAGAAHFTAELVDADVACNQLNWQWVAGTGAGGQPHRIFNPTTQGRRFDPRGEYIRRYVAELDGLPAGQLHDPDPVVRRERRYPAPIVDHAEVVAVRGRRSG